MATTKRKQILTQHSIFEKSIKIRPEQNGSFMVVVYEENTGPMGDVYCFTTVDDLIQFFTDQALVHEANQ